jgi:hypothetical protein
MRALKRLKHARASARAGADGAAQRVGGQGSPLACLERLGLADAHSFEDLFTRRLFAANL